jgi:hypothetical protein
MPSKANTDTEHLYNLESIRISQMRVRLREERRLVHELNEKFKISSAAQIFRPASLSLGYVDSFFLSQDALRAQRSPAQLSKWLDQAEGYLAAAVTQRKFCEGRLERYGLTIGQSERTRHRRFASLLQVAAWLALVCRGVSPAPGNN